MFDGDEAPFFIRLDGDNEASAFFVQLSLENATLSIVDGSVCDPPGFDRPFVFIDSPEFKFINACQGDIPRLFRGTCCGDAGCAVQSSAPGVKQHENEKSDKIPCHESPAF